jgi:hypothetical protein
MANKWLTHVKATMKAHKGKSFGDVLKMAKKTYKKGKMSGGSEGGVMPAGGPKGAFPEAAPTGGRRRSRRGRKSRRGTRRG